MGCLTASFSRGSVLHPSLITMRKPLRGDVSRKDYMLHPLISRKDRVLDAEVKTLESLYATANKRGRALKAKVGIICSIPQEWVIRFAKDKLVWEGETNQEGVVLYNTLTSLGEWSLEEITIEELL